MPINTLRPYPGEVLLDPTNAPMQGLDRGNEPGHGLAPRPHAGPLPGSKEVPIQVIPRNKWVKLIQDLEQNEQRLSDLRYVDPANPILSLHQGTTLFCWANSVISAMMILQAKANARVVRLSPASVAAPIKGYSNSPGYNGEALKYIVQNGVCSQLVWDANTWNNPSLDNAISRADRTRPNQTITEYWDLQPKNFDQLMTLLLRGIPVAIGLDWWGHEVCALDPVWLGGEEFGVRIWNSWGETWSDHVSGLSSTNGMAVLSERYATPENAVAPRF